jgi:hypothetical protein
MSFEAYHNNRHNVYTHTIIDTIIDTIILTNYTNDAYTPINLYTYTPLHLYLCVLLHSVYCILHRQVLRGAVTCITIIDTIIHHILTN